MTHTSCPTAVVNAPVECVWALLIEPAGWGTFFDVRIKSITPAGPAAVGQRILCETGPRILHLKLGAIDAACHRLGLAVQLPFRITVAEDLQCVAIASDSCRISYHCDFSFPQGWRGALARMALWRKLHSGPVDSLCRLKHAAERRYASLKAA